MALAMGGKWILSGSPDERSTGLDNLIWKLKMWFRKLLPIALIGAVLYGGYDMYRAGVFRRGVGPAVTYMLHKIPYFGSRFGHYRGHGVAKSGRYTTTRGYKKYRGSRRHRRH